MRLTAWHWALTVSAASHVAAFGFLPTGPSTERPGQQTSPVLRFTVAQAQTTPERQTPYYVAPESEPALAVEALVAELNVRTDSPLPARSMVDHTQRADLVSQLHRAQARLDERPAAMHPVDVTTPPVENSVANSVPARPTAGGNHPPAYPMRARRHHWEGTTLLAADIDAEGRVISVRIEQSSGHDILDQAARTAIHKWTFQAAHIGNLSFESTVRIPVVFTLETE